MIILAGRSWEVPMLAPRQNRIVLPLLMSLGARPAEQYEALLDIAFAALGRDHPGIGREEFEDWPIATHELLDALPVIARKTGLLRLAHGSPKRIFEPPDWDAIIAEVMNFLPGTSWDYWEDALTIPRLEALRAEWRKHPPAALLLAAWLGYRPRPRDAEAVEELMRFFPSGQLRLN